MLENQMPGPLGAYHSAFAIWQIKFPSLEPPKDLRISRSTVFPVDFELRRRRPSSRCSRRRGEEAPPKLVPKETFEVPSAQRETGDLVLDRWEPRGRGTHGDSVW